MTGPILYIGSKNYSSWSMRPWLVFQHFGIDFEERLIPLFDENWGAAMRDAMPMNVRKSLPGRGHTPEAMKDIQRITALWTQCRRDFGAGGDFLFGAFSAADAMYAPVVSRFVTYGVDLDPVCAAYRDAIMTLPAMQAWCAAGRDEPWVVPHDEID